MYYGDVSDDEPAVSKKITYVTRTYGNHITGLYAPAGEIIKIKMTVADFKSSGGVKVIIGQALSNDKANNIWAAREFNRMPVAVNAMNITEDTYTLERDGAGKPNGLRRFFSRRTDLYQTHEGRFCFQHSDRRRRKIFAFYTRLYD